MGVCGVLAVSLYINIYGSPWRVDLGAKKTIYPNLSTIAPS